MATENPWTITGKVVIVTGSNTGIGKVTARELVKQGAARVILACRNVAAAEEAAKEIRTAAGLTDEAEAARRVVVKHLDLASLKSVRQFAADINETEPALHCLINNAGLETPYQRQLTEDGYERTFQTNHLGHFLLTKLLLDLLKKSKPSRVVVVASMAYLSTMPFGYDLDDPNQDHRVTTWLGYSGSKSYGQSKLANIFFARTLHKQLNGGYDVEGASSGVSVFCLHPGIIRSEFLRSRTRFSHLDIIFLGAINVEEGAKTTIYCATEPGLEKQSGKYFDKCKVAGLWWIARDNRKADALWEISDRFIEENAKKSGDDNQ